MANEQHNREEKGGQDRRGQDQDRRAEKVGRHRDEDKGRREQKEQKGRTAQQDRRS